MTMDASTLTRNLQPLLKHGWAELGPGADGAQPHDRRDRRPAGPSAPRRDALWKRAQLDAQCAARRRARWSQLHELLDECLALLEPDDRGHPMTDAARSAAPCAPRARSAFWLVLLAAAGTFALTMGARQSMGLFLSTLNTIDRARPGEHQPGVRVRPAVVGTRRSRSPAWSPTATAPAACSSSACCWSRSARRWCRS